MGEMLARVRMRVYGSRLAGLEPVFLGFCLVVSFSTTMSLFTASCPFSLPNVGWLTNLVRASVFLGAALLVGKSGLRLCRVRLACAAAMLSCVGTVCVAVCSWSPGLLLSAVYAVGLALASVGYSLLYLLWIELYAKMDMRHVIVAFALTHLASALVSLVLAQAESRAVPIGGLLCMPAVSAWCYGRGLRASKELPYMQGEEARTGWTFPVRPVVLLGVFTLANNFVRHYLTADLKGTVLLGVVFAAVLVLALAFWRADRFDLGSLFVLCLPLVVAGSLCVLIALPGFGTLGGFLTNAAYTLLSVFVTVLLCSISYRYGVDAIWLFGFACAATSLGSLGASVLSGWADGFAADSAARALAVSAVVLVFVCLYSAYSNKGVPLGSWGIVRAGSDESSREPAETYVERCARLARLHGLTKREEEVMLLLAGTKTFAQIEEELSISNSTLKTHSRHIYAKLEVSGRRELAELVGVEG